MRLRTAYVMTAALVMFTVVAVASLYSTAGVVTVRAAERLQDEFDMPLYSAADGMYTEEQRARGEEVYTNSCAACHGATLIGGALMSGEEPPALVGDEFMRSWNGRTVGDLFEIVARSMPQDDAGSLAPRAYADVIAYIMSKNDFPAGEDGELAGDAVTLRLIYFPGTRAALEAVAVPDRSVLDGVYDTIQGERGATAYSEICAECHGPELEGGDVVPPLAGDGFMRFWLGTTAGDLFERVRTSMPPDDPGKLTAQQYTDIVAHILKTNGFPAGAEEMGASYEALRMIRIEKTKAPE